MDIWLVGGAITAALYLIQWPCLTGELEASYSRSGGEGRSSSLSLTAAKRLASGSSESALYDGEEPDSAAAAAAAATAVGRRSDVAITASGPEASSLALLDGGNGVVVLTGGLQDHEQRLPARRGPELEGVGKVVRRGDAAEERLLVLGRRGKG